MSGYVRGLTDLRKRDAAEFGAKAAYLGELTAAELPVPAGFALAPAAFVDSISAADVLDELIALHDEAMAGDGDLAIISARMRDLVGQAGITGAVTRALRNACDELGSSIAVAVRSSDNGSSDSGLWISEAYATVANIHGMQALYHAVTTCWQSQFSLRALTFRTDAGLTGFPAIAVVVQEMIAADRAGLVSTADPLTRSTHIIIEAVFGNGESVTSGQVQPDLYVVDSETLDLIESRIGYKTSQLIMQRDHGAMLELCPATTAQQQVLSDKQIRRIAGLALAAQVHNDCPQELEWAICNGIAWIVQARPITVSGLVPDHTELRKEHNHAE